VTALLTLNVILLALAAWAALFRVIPTCASSLFRYRLWRLRDQLVDDIRNEEFRDNAQPMELVCMIEAVIAGAQDLTAFKAWAAHATSRGLAIPDSLRLPHAHPRDKDRLEKVLNELYAAMLSKALLGTPSGWLFSIVLVPVAIVVTLTSRLFTRDPHEGSLFEDAKWHVREEFELDPALAAITNSRTPQQALYQHV
jgi:hypothetical protein